MALRSSLQSKFTVETMFLQKTKRQSTDEIIVISKHLKKNHKRLTVGWERSQKDARLGPLDYSLPILDLSFA